MNFSIKECIYRKGLQDGYRLGVLAAKPVNLGSLPGTHMVKKENQSLQVVLILPHGRTHVCSQRHPHIHPPTHTDMHKLFGLLLNISRSSLCSGITVNSRNFNTLVSFIHSANLYQIYPNSRHYFKCQGIITNADGAQKHFEKMHISKRDVVLLRYFLHLSLGNLLLNIEFETYKYGLSTIAYYDVITDSFDSHNNRNACS